MLKFLPVSVFLFVLIPASLQAEILFHEEFEGGVSPFSFSSESNFQNEAAQYFTGALLSVPGERGFVWRNTFHRHCNDSYFGFRLARNWAITNKFHWRAFVKFGDSDNSPEWATSAASPGCNGIQQARGYELKFPDVGGGSGLELGRIIGKLRAQGSGDRGSFRVYTPDGRDHNHTAQGAPPFVSNRWYMIEFMVEDNGNNDVVKIWINNNNPNDPDYEHIGGNMFDSSQWSGRLPITHGYRNHNVPRDTNFYFDGVAISTTFIGLGDGSVVIPGIPGLD